MQETRTRCYVQGLASRCRVVQRRMDSWVNAKRRSAEFRPAFRKDLKMERQDAEKHRDFDWQLC